MAFLSVHPPFADVESVMNSIVSLLLILETEKQEALIESLCEKLVKFREGERPSLRMQLWVLYLLLLTSDHIHSPSGWKLTLWLSFDVSRDLDLAL